MSVIDTLSKIGTYRRSIANAVNITDTIAGIKLVAVALADAVGITDSIATVVAIGLGIYRGLVSSAKTLIGRITDRGNRTDTEDW